MSQRRKRLKPSAPTAAAASNAHLGAWDPAWEPRAITASNEDHLVWDPDPDPPPDPDPVHARFLRQLEMMTREKGLIFDFLGGRFAHTPDSDEESEARRLLAETLRYGRSLDERIRWRLAAMIEDPPPAGELWKVVIEPRGRLSKDSRDREIAGRILAWRTIGGKRMKWAVDQVKQEYGVSRETIYLAWRKFGDQARAASGKILKTDKSDRRRWRRRRAEKDQG